MWRWKPKHQQHSSSRRPTSGAAPPMPHLYTTEPINLMDFQAHASTSVKVMDAAMEDIDALELEQVDIDVMDLCEPSLDEIIKATTLDAASPIIPPQDKAQEPQLLQLAHQPPRDKQEDLHQQQEQHLEQEHNLLSVQHQQQEQQEQLEQQEEHLRQHQGHQQQQRHATQTIGGIPVVPQLVLQGCEREPQQQQLHQLQQQLGLQWQDEGLPTLQQPEAPPAPSAKLVQEWQRLYRLHAWIFDQYGLVPPPDNVVPSVPSDVVHSVLAVPSCSRDSDLLSLLPAEVAGPSLLPELNWLAGLVDKDAGTTAAAAATLLAMESGVQQSIKAQDAFSVPQALAGSGAFLLSGAADNGPPSRGLPGLVLPSVGGGPSSCGLHQGAAPLWLSSRVSMVPAAAASPPSDSATAASTAIAKASDTTTAAASGKAAAAALEVAATTTTIGAKLLAEHGVSSEEPSCRLAPVLAPGPAPAATATHALPSASAATRKTTGTTYPGPVALVPAEAVAPVAEVLASAEGLSTSLEVFSARDLEALGLSLAQVGGELAPGAGVDLTQQEQQQEKQQQPDQQLGRGQRGLGKKVLRGRGGSRDGSRGSSRGVSGGGRRGGTRGGRQQHKGASSGGSTEDDGDGGTPAEKEGSKRGRLGGSSGRAAKRRVVATEGRPALKENSPLGASEQGAGPSEGAVAGAGPSEGAGAGLKASNQRKRGRGQPRPTQPEKPATPGSGIAGAKCVQAELRRKLLNVWDARRKGACHMLASLSQAVGAAASSAQDLMAKAQERASMAEGLQQQRLSLQQQQQAAAAEAAAVAPAGGRASRRKGTSPSASAPAAASASAAAASAAAPTAAAAAASRLGVVATIAASAAPAPVRIQHLKEGGAEDLLPSDELLVEIAVYCAGRSDVTSDEMLMLGSQSPAQLADAISCVAEANLRSVGEGSSGAAAAGSGAAAGGPLLSATGRSGHGAYLFFEGTFLNDMRRPGALDYSRPIIEFCNGHGAYPTHFDAKGKMQQAALWSHQQQQQSTAAPTATTANMEDSTLMDLSVRLSGWPAYLYCHLGCCEHLIQVRDVRRLHASDPQQRASYPLQLLDKVARVRRCDLCEHNTAEKITYSDVLAPKNPCFYCPNCFEMMHLDVEGRRIKPEVMVYAYSGGSCIGPSRS